MNFDYKPEDSMKALIQLAISGHYPLFHDQWINDSNLQKKSTKITGFERAKAKKLFQQVLKHRTLEHKKIVVMSMNDEDRFLFMKAFFKLVEGRILDQKPEIH